MAYTVITKPTVGTGVSKSEIGDLMVDNFAYLYALRDQVFWIPLNDSTPLVAGAKAYWRVPAKYNGGLLVGVAAGCVDGSTSGAVVLALKDGAGGTSMLSTNVTLDQSETDTSTSSSPGVIDTSHDDLVLGHKLEVSVVSEGTGVTYCGFEITVRPPA